MKWYLLLHLLNLYVIPAAMFKITTAMDTRLDWADIAMGLIFGVVPLGCFCISLLYGLLKRDGFVYTAFLAALLCYPYIFIPFVTGQKILGRLYATTFIGFCYFSIALIGSIAGIILYHIFQYILSLIRRR